MMKIVYSILRPLLIILCGFCFLSCGGQKNKTSHVPNVISEYVPLADPFILYHGDTYYAYGTSPKSDIGFEVYYSKTLDSWEKHPDMLLDKINTYGDKWFWAPEVYYNESDKKFYLYYSAEEHICVAKSDSPLGPFIQDEKKPMREEKGIDSSLFIDDDGTPYIYFVRFTDGNVIWVAELEKDWVTIKEETLKQCFAVSQDWEKDLGRVVEGPSVVKQNGVYYMLYSGNDFRSHNYGVGYATASSPMGEWEKSESNPILQKERADMVGTGHGAIFLDKDGKSKYVFHAHFSPTEVSPRKMCIMALIITDKGEVSMGNHIIETKVVD